MDFKANSAVRKKGLTIFGPYIIIRVLNIRTIKLLDPLREISDAH